MGFVLAAWNSFDRATAPKPNFYKYNAAGLDPDGQPYTTDNLATIAASGYFDAWAPNFAKDDLIYVNASDGQAFYKVTSAQGVIPVTIAALDTVPPGSIDTADLADGAVTNAKVNASAAIALSKLAAVPAGHVVMGNGSNVATPTEITGAVGFESDGNTVLNENCVNADQIVDGAVGFAQMNAHAKAQTVCVPVSFESGEIYTHEIPFTGRDVYIVEVSYEVTSQIAGTDAATITLSNSEGAMANGVIEIDASSPVGTRDGVAPTTNNVILNGTVLSIAPAKTTAGGTVNLYINYRNGPV